jgi:hypothetical protein
MSAHVAEERQLLLPAHGAVQREDSLLEMRPVRMGN